MNDINTTYVLMAAALMGLGSILLRAFPFVVLKGKTDQPFIAYLGKWSPAVILSILVIYCIKPSMTDSQLALPAILSSLLVVALHHKFRKPLLSILSGTGVYMLLNATSSF